MISGGKTSYDSEDETLVQLFNENGTYICDLPKLPENRSGHTQNGLIICGGIGLVDRSQMYVNIGSYVKKLLWN